MKFKRVWHPFDQWEEIQVNMWGEVEDKNKAIEDAVAFTGNHQLYGSYMRRVAKEMPISCENALTDSCLNQKAWIGHAACALALRIPEYITRLAWGRLTNEQQLLANKEAERAIASWKDAYAKRHSLHADMGGSLL